MRDEQEIRSTFEISDPNRANLLQVPPSEQLWNFEWPRASDLKELVVGSRV